MAITTVTTPNTTYNAVYEAVNFDFTSNTATIFQLRADIYVNGSYVVTLDAPVSFGTTNEFSFDISEILQNHVDYSHTTTTSGHDLLACAPSSSLFYMLVYEVYTVLGVTTTAWKNDQTGTPDVTTSTFVAHLTAFNPFEGSTTYLMQEGAPKSFLTLRGATSNLMRGEFMQMDFITDVAKVDFNIEEYDLSGGLLATTVTTAYTTIRARGKAIIDGNSLNANTTKLVTWLDNNTSGNRISDTMTFRIVEDCGNSPIVLHWGNYLGGMEQYTFNKRQLQESRSGHVSMRRGSTALIENVTGNRGVIYSAYSDIETDETLEFLNELPSNSKNTKWKRAGLFYPIIISNGKTTKKYYDSEGKINGYKIGFELSKKTPVIRG